MSIYNEYADILDQNNFADLPYPVTATGGVYTLSYYFLANLQDLNNVIAGSYSSGYYSGLAYASTDASGGPTYFVPTPTGVVQGMQIIMTSDPNSYSDYFGNVANVVFSASSPNPLTGLIPADIVIGGLNNTSPSPDHIFDGSNSNSFAATLTSSSTPPANLSALQDAEYGDIWFNTSTTQITDNWASAGSAGTPEFEVLLHELALSLGETEPAPGAFDNNPYYSISSTNLSNLPGLTGVVISGLQIDDILAIQSIYGADYNTRHQNTVYGANFGFGPANTEFVYTIWDGGGRNIIDASSYNGPSIINLNEGEFSSIGPADNNYINPNGGHNAFDNVAIAYGTIIQDAIGTTGSTTFVGNQWNDILAGAANSNGNVFYSDEVLYDPTFGPGVDWSNNGNSSNVGSQWSDPYYTPVPSLKNDVLIGDGNSNTFYSGIGNIVIDGGYSKSSIDSATINWSTYWDSAHHFTQNQFGTTFNISAAPLTDLPYSSAGNNTANYSLLSSEDTQITAGQPGIDVIFSSSSGEGVVQKGALNGSGNGVDGTDDLFAIQTVVGTSGNDIFAGANGQILPPTGADAALHYYGGAGDDTYSFNFTAGHDYGFVAVDDSSGFDKVSVTNGNVAFAYNTASLGTGEVYEQLSFFTVSNEAAPSLFLNKTEIDLGHSIEQLQLDNYIFDAKAFLDELNSIPPGSYNETDMAGLIGFEQLATGNNQLLQGFGAADTLDSQGYIVTMAAGSGNDTYIMSNPLDVISENPSGGTDLVDSSVTCTLADNVENLTLTGTSNLAGTGNTLPNIIIGNSGNNTLDGGAGSDTLSGGAGNDTYLFHNGSGHDIVTDTSGTADVVSFDSSVAASSVSYSRSGNDLSIAYGTSGDTVTVSGYFSSPDTVENVTFSDGTLHDATYISQHIFSQTGTSGNDVFTGTAGDDVLLGLGGNDTLTGLAGNDSLDGGTGADVMTGGMGNDTYFVDNTGDVVTENPGEGTDTVVTGISYTLPNNVENLILTGTSSLTGTGNGLDNVITANSGGDTLVGGAGSDTYVFHTGSGHDVVVDSSGTLDTISFDSSVSQSSVTYFEMGANDLLINYGTSGDNITVAGYFSGADTIEQVHFSNGTTENASYISAHLANVFTGTSGNDTLAGTAGPDYMHGLTGNDTYIVDNTGDVVLENSGEGTDTVDTSVNYTMPANVEIMYATVAGITITGGNGNDTLYGDHPPPGSLGATLFGGAGNDILNDNGGQNYMAGGTGDDTYYLTANATIVENLGEGTDTVITPYGYALPANVENLTLTGTNYVNETGNSLNNIITGNTSDNTLDGGTGVDTLIGNGGNDRFIVNNASDVVEAGSGTDTIVSSVSWDMSSAGHNNSDVENLFLTGNTSIAGVGNDLNNTMETFGTGQDTISGGSGADFLLNESIGTGINTLDGGTGADFLMSSALGRTVFVVDNSGDTVLGDSGGMDTIQSSISFSLSDSTHNLSQYVNNLTLTAANLIGTANNNGDTVVGNYGGDTLNGGTGNDFLEVVSGVAIGGAGDDYLWNFSAISASTLEGGDGNDTFISRNAGDHLVGGNGNDVYYLAGPLTTAPVETSGGGTDTIHENDSFVSLSDPGYTNIENLYLDFYGLNGTLIGNTLANILSGDLYANSLSGLAGIDTLYGNGGNDTLDGGTGADTMYGGTGDDTYYVDNTGDVVTENPGSGEGTDTVLVSVSGYTLATNVENLGTSAVNGVGVMTGNGGDNVITGGGNSGETLIGGAGNDTLDPGGTGSGTHSLVGGLGNDTFIVNSINHDLVFENSAEGTDTVQLLDSSINTGYTLPANVENLIMLSGSSALNANGNSLDNVLTGNGAANSLNGGTGSDILDGGDGLDTLTGGTGSDTFVFHGSTAFNNIDVVTDFKTSDNDKINISDVITGYHSGLNIDNFVQLTTSGSNTLLKVDTDGSGTSYTQIATLNGITGLNVDTLVANGELIVS